MKTQTAIPYSRVIRRPPLISQQEGNGHLAKNQCLGVYWIDDHNRFRNTRWLAMPNNELPGARSLTKKPNNA